MSERLLGQVSIKIGSTLLKSKNGATINPGGVQRTPVPNDQGGVDYMRGEVLPSTVSCTLVVDRNYNSDTIGSWENVQLTYTADNGLVWSITGAWVESPPEINAGEAPVTFNGPPAERLA